MKSLRHPSKNEIDHDRLQLLTENPRQTTGPALKQLIGPFKIAFKNVEDAMQPLLQDWMTKAKNSKNPLFLGGSNSNFLTCL